MKYRALFSIAILLFLCSCRGDTLRQEEELLQHDSITVTNSAINTPQHTPRVQSIQTDQIGEDRLVNFAESLVGVPYRYGSTDPAIGFDCSGFITYVFNHFNIKVPRSSVDFTNVGQEIPLAVAKRGDLILFTGTDSSIRIVGHMGIVTENSDTLKFIHSTSGKQYGVTITPLSNYYKGRFVKVIRVFS